MGKKSILLVEDNPDDQVLTQRALKKARISNQILVMNDGEAALLYLLDKDTIDLPQVVLLDLKLPKVDGMEVLRQLRANEKTKILPVVILTSSKEEIDLLTGYKSGCNSYIVKPVDIDQFDRAVEQLGLYWVLLNTPVPGTT